MRKKSKKENGGAALEYLIVSACALMMGLAAAGFVGKIFKERLDEIDKSVQEDWEKNWTSWDE